MEDIEQLLRRHWGYQGFRPLQKEIISSVIEGNDTLALLPTGGGKSICYQVPALAMQGICVVISPLIALINDQVRNLSDRGIPAIALHAGLSYREIEIALDNACYGNYKFIYISPERIQTEIFQARIPDLKVNLIAVDEAHCISQWGYDFRPAYLQIHKLRESLPDIPVLALTATATEKVRNDIAEKLEFKRGFKLYQKSFDRQNLIYASIIDEDKKGKLLRTLEKLRGCGLIYVSTRKRASEVSEYLYQQNFSVDYYHAGLSFEQRNKKQENWLNDQTRIMVCTNAFGMGIDKPDVRFVIHYDLPVTLESYYQEAGRAGRDGQKSFAIVLFNEHDKHHLLQQDEQSAIEKAFVNNIYHALGNYLQIPVGTGQGCSYDFDLMDFCKQFNFKSQNVFQALKILETGGYIVYSESLFETSRLKIEVGNTELYDFEVSHQKFDPLIKSILRSYGGCFTEYVSISEKVLANRAGMSLKSAVEMLHTLHRLKIIDFIPQKNEPQIGYLQDRVQKEYLWIEWDVIKKRQQLKSEKLKAVIQYAEETTMCKSKILLKYFGEELYDNCGHCDYCLKKIQQPASDFNKELKSKVKTLLADQKLGLQELVAKVNFGDELMVISGLREMIERKEIGWVNDRVLEWKGVKG